MTPRQEALRKLRIRLIHTGKKALGLDDDAYRAMLLRLTGQSSSKELDLEALEAVVEEMRRKGFKAEPRKSLAMPQQRKIAAMWAELYREGAVKDGSPRALDRFVKRVAGVDSVRFLVPGDANKVIEALKAWQGRIGQGRDRSGRASG